MIHLRGSKSRTIILGEPPAEHVSSVPLFCFIWPYRLFLSFLSLCSLSTMFFWACPCKACFSHSDPIGYSMSATRWKKNYINQKSLPAMVRPTKGSVTEPDAQKSQNLNHHCKHFSSNSHLQKRTFKDVSWGTWLQMMVVRNMTKSLFFTGGHLFIWDAQNKRQLPQCSPALLITPPPTQHEDRVANKLVTEWVNNWLYWVREGDH